jgi:sporulation protein YlmC with PRC-barrel domain
MSSKRIVGSAFLALVGLAVAAGSGLMAQEKGGAAPSDKGLDVLFKASAMRGLPVVNAANEDLGKIDDLAITPDGTVSYLAVSHGGALGVGDKLFAVPYAAFTFHDNLRGKGAGHFYARLPIGKEHFEQGPGFKKDAWPAEPDMGFLKAAGKEGARVKEGVREAARDAKEAATGAKKRIYRASKLIDSSLKNNQNENIGKIGDLMIHTSTGKVAYVALAYGGGGGVGDKLFAVAFDAFIPKALGGKAEETWTLDVEKTYFDGNPGFDKKAWPSAPPKELTKAEVNKK